MNVKNLNKLSAKALADLEAKVAIAKQAAQDRARADLRGKVEAMCEAAGFKVSDLFGNGPRSGRKVPAKYRDPKNPANVWTGRGRMPAWVQAATGGDRNKLGSLAIQ